MRCIATALPPTAALYRFAPPLSTERSPGGGQPAYVLVGPTARAADKQTIMSFYCRIAA
jgi:hypothetical protein